MDDLGGQLITLVVRGLFFLVGGGFGLVGGVLVLLGVLAIWQDVRVRGWPTVPGIIRHAAVETRLRSETMTSHHACILYDYEVGGRQYAGDRLAFSRRVSRKAAEADRAKYPPGKLVRVYYDPRRPQRAVLERRAGIAGTMILLLVGAMLLATATAAIWAGIEAGRDRGTFEVPLERSGIKDGALQRIAEIVHDIGLKDGKFGRPEATGIAQVIDGTIAATDDDMQRVARASAVLDDLYAAFSRRRR